MLKEDHCLLIINNPSHSNLSIADAMLVTKLSVLCLFLFTLLKKHTGVLFLGIEVSPG
jgi:hypothetical protein